MAHYPKKVYVIFPFNEDGSVAGVYVGASSRVNERIKCHRCTHIPQGKQTLLHDLMRNNGFNYLVIDVINHWHENHIEYDWMDFFEHRTNLMLFNNQTGLCCADWHRLEGVTA